MSSDRPPWCQTEQGVSVAATPRAEATLAAGLYVTMRQGRLACPDATSDSALAAAIIRAMEPVALTQPTASQVRLHDAGRRTWIFADVAPVPPNLAMFRVNAAVLVLLHLASSTEAQVTRLMRLYRLTAAEAEVALAIAEGGAVRVVAERRGVAVSTLRSQVAAILAKTATTRQAELVALVLRAIS